MRTDVPRATARPESGFTLLEIIVAIAIFTVVTGAIYAMLEVGRSDVFKTQQLTDTMQNARAALNTINRDAINAGVGYWKGGAKMPDGTLGRLVFLPVENDGDEDWLTPVVPGDGVRPIAVDGATVETDAVTFAYQDNSFNNGQALTVSAVNFATNTVTVDQTAPCHDGDLYVYIVDDGTAPALGSLKTIDDGSKTLVFSTGDPLGLNNPGGHSTFKDLKQSAACKRITWVTDFVNDDHVLVRRVYGNTRRIVGEGVKDDGLGGVVPSGSSGQGVGFVEMPLAYGIDDFQVKYVMDDGTTVDDVGASVDEDGNVIPGSRNANRARIRMVRVAIKLRSSQTDRSGKPLSVDLTATFYTPNLVIKERPAGNSL
jgi:prepilin-type N-terminal cleavage/methylation domain-containing protein